MRHGKFARFMSLLLCTLLVLSLLIGCSKAAPQNAGTAAPASSAAPAASAAPASGPEPITLPIVSKPTTLSMFIELDAKAAASLTNLNEMIAYKEMEKRTGIHIDFKHPTANQVDTQLNLMIASGDLTDMMYTGWSGYPGGPEKAAKDGVIQPLNELLGKYAPNLTKLLNSDPQLKKDAMTDTGMIYMFPFMRYEKIMRFFDGYQIRADWLEKLGLKNPLTLDEWYNVLKAFKEKDPNGNGKADEIPVVGRGLEAIATFATAWGLNYPLQKPNNTNAFYQEGGKVKYAPMQPQYKEFLTTMNKWYKEGLIDKDFLTTDAKNFDAKIMNELAGAWYGKLNGDMGKYMTDMPKKNPKFNLYSAVINAPDGKSYNFNSGAISAISGDGMAISPKSKFQKEAAKWVDYAYSPDGMLLLSYGIEGQTYTMVNGKPAYTDLITKNKLPFPDAISSYTPASIKPRMYQSMGYWDYAMVADSQRVGNKYLMDKTTIERAIPTGITPTTDEAKILSKAVNDLTTYVNEKTSKFIIGQEPLENFDKFVAEIKNMNVDGAIDVLQKSLDRYQKRK